jgi:hypothetical protein
MISEFNYPDRDWQLFITKVDLEYYLKFIKKFEIVTKPIGKKSSFWHETIIEYDLEKIENNKIRIDYSEENITIMFTKNSNDDSRQFLKAVAQTIVDELDSENPCILEKE